MGRSFHLTRRMGLISDENNQAAALEDQQGRLWIGMLGGACILTPGCIPSLSSAPHLWSLMSPGSEGPSGVPQEVTLPPGFTNLAVHVMPGSPNASFPVRFETRARTPMLLGTLWNLASARSITVG